MRFLQASIAAFAATAAISVSALSTTGIEGLVSRRLSKHANSFQFEIVDATAAAGVYDQYTVSSTKNDTILVQGTTLSALATG